MANVVFDYHMAQLVIQKFAKLAHNCLSDYCLCVLHTLRDYNRRPALRMWNQAMCEPSGIGRTQFSIFLQIEKGFWILLALNSPLCVRMPLPSSRFAEQCVCADQFYGDSCEQNTEYLKASTSASATNQPESSINQNVQKGSRLSIREDLKLKFKGCPHSWYSWSWWSQLHTCSVCT